MLSGLPYSHTGVSALISFVSEVMCGEQLFRGHASLWDPRHKVPDGHLEDVPKIHYFPSFNLASLADIQGGDFLLRKC